MATPEDILTLPTFEEVPTEEEPAELADDGIATDLLRGGDEEELRKLMMQQLMVQQLLAQAAKQSGDTATRGTEIDTYKAFADPSSPFRNPEYAPFATGGLKVLFPGGSPYPVSPAQEQAAERFGKLATASNVLDAFVNTPQVKGLGGQQQQSQPIMDLISSLFAKKK